MDHLYGDQAHSYCLLLFDMGLGVALFGYAILGFALSEAMALS